MIKQAWCNTKHVCSNSKEDNAEYYRIDWDKARELGYGDSTSVETFIMKGLVGVSRNLKLKVQSNASIAPTGYAMILGIDFVNSIEFYPTMIYDTTNDEIITNIDNFNRAFEILNSSKLIPCFIPITKEEFYNIDG